MTALRIPQLVFYGQLPCQFCPFSTFKTAEYPSTVGSLKGTGKCRPRSPTRPHTRSMRSSCRSGYQQGSWSTGGRSAVVPLRFANPGGQALVPCRHPCRTGPALNAIGPLAMSLSPVMRTPTTRRGSKATRRNVTGRPRGVIRERESHGYSAVSFI